MMTKMRKVMIVAGEASGDTHASKLVRGMREAVFMWLYMPILA